jgi:hypothetical protein
VNWTELLTAQIDATYRATDGLMKLVKKDDLGWKPRSGKNWMTTAQVLDHLTNACGWCIECFVKGDWTPPEPPKKKGAARAGKGGKKVEPDPAAGMLPAEAMPAVKSVAEARKKLEADKQVALAAIAKLGEAGLSGTLAEAPWAPGVKKPLGLHALEMVGHLAQHKGQLFYYLKLQGKPVHTGNLWGM